MYAQGGQTRQATCCAMRGKARYRVSEVTVERMSVQQAARYARKDRVLRYDRYTGGMLQPGLMDSFMLKDGRYACRVKSDEGDDYYLVYSNIPAGILSDMDDLDHRELLRERRKTEHESFSSIMGQSENNADEEPGQREAYDSWFVQAHDGVRAVDSRKKVLGIILDSLNARDRKLLCMLYGMNLTTQEMMQELGVSTKQALTNRKTRLLSKIRRIYEELGYDVPTLEELLEEQRAAREEARKRKRGRI